MVYTINTIAYNDLQSTTFWQTKIPRKLLKTYVSGGFLYHETSGIRTRDNLIKSQLGHTVLRHFHNIYTIQIP